MTGHSLCVYLKLTCADKGPFSQGYYSTHVNMISLLTFTESGHGATGVGSR